MTQSQSVPKLIATMVIRGSQQQNSQGGVFLIDPEQQLVHLAMDWNNSGIDWRGRGFELGLRGIAIDGDVIYLAASDELFAFTPAFERIGSWRHPLLKQCRAMAVHQRKLFLTSAAFDSILGFDLEKQCFDWAMHIGMKQFRFNGALYDPDGDDVPLPLGKLELTDIQCNAKGMYISGVNTGGMLHYNGETIQMSATLPPGSRNAQPFRKGVLFIDNEIKALRYSGREGGNEDRALALPVFRPEDLQHLETDLSGEALVGFGRGLIALNDRAVAVGSSPASVSVYDLQDNKLLFSVNLSRDVRTVIHGLAIWPYS
jgi:hypothetical protein